MNKIFATFAAAAILAVPAAAQVNFDNPVVNPQPGTVSELSEITVTFPAVADVDFNSRSDISLTHDGTPVGIDLEEGYTEDNQIIVTLDAPQTADGTYVLTFNEGSLCGMDAGYNEFVDNPEMSFTWIIGEGGGSVNFGTPVVTPEPGEVTSLKDIKILFPDLEEVDLADNKNRYSIYMTLNGERIDVGDDYMYGPKPGYPEWNSLVYYLPKEYTEPGEYVMTIPVGMIVSYSEDGSSALNSEQWVYTWTIAGSGPDFAFEADPVNGESVTALSEVAVTFTQIDKVLVEENDVVVTLDGGVLDKAGYTVSASGDDSIVRISFNPAVVAEDDAVAVAVKFPAGSLLGQKNGEEDGFNALPVVLTYNVLKAVAYDLTAVMSRPAPDADGNISAEKSLESILFSCDVAGITVSEGTEPNVTIREVNGDYEASGRLVKGFGINSNLSYFIVSFGSEPVYNGEYVITIAKEAFGDEAWHRNPASGRTNAEINLDFTLVDGSDRDRFSIEPTAVTPEEGTYKTGEEFATVTVTFPEGIGATAEAGATLAGKMADYAVSAFFEKTAEGTYSVTFTPAPTENGDYVFTINAGAFGDADYLADNASGLGSVAVSRTYTLDDLLSVDGIILDAEDAEIFSVQGLRLDVRFSELPAGLYIVNGKKVIKK